MLALIPPVWVSAKSVSNDLVCERLGVSHFSQQKLSLPSEYLPEAFTVTVEYEGQPKVISLQRQSVRGPTFRVLAQQITGKLVEVPAPPETSYHGFIEGEPETSVAASLLPSGLRARIYAGHGPGWLVRPMKDIYSKDLREMHIVYSEADVEPLDLTNDALTPMDTLDSPPRKTDCNFDTLSPLADAKCFAEPTDVASAEDCNIIQADISFDTDYEYYEYCSSDSNTVVHNIEDAINEINLIYRRDVLIEHLIGTIIVRSDPNTCPYKDLENASLTAFRVHWNANHTDIIRDIAHYATGKPASWGGVAYLGVVCNQSWGYGATRHYALARIMRHELGHNWGAHDYHAGCLEGTTIMCGNSISRFAGQTALDIIAYRDTLGCLVDIGPCPIPLDPYACMDIVTAQVGHSPIIIDVLSNDHDGNCDEIEIDAYDSTSYYGGTVQLSADTGPNGRDELYYTPLPGLARTDTFGYTISDGTGRHDSTTVSVSFIYTVPDIYPTIQAAINDANNGDIIVVSPGTYTGDGNRDIDFGGRAIIVRSIDANDPDIVAATVIDCNGTDEEPHRGFYFHNGEDTNSVLDGLTITNGYANYGGGIYCASGSSPTIKSCIIIDNFATTDGGGIYGCDGRIADCHISDNNSGRWGGGLCECNGEIDGCIIEGNQSNNNHSGGGLANCDGKIINCKIVGNSSSCYGGGLAGCDAEIRNCTISDNWSEDGGGGLKSCHGKIVNCLIANNSTPMSGGAFRDCSGEIVSCTIIGNSGRHGGAFTTCGGAIIQNNIIAYNTASIDGGAIYGLCENSYNDFWDNSPDNFAGGALAGVGDIFEDPLFVDLNDDYHLKSEGWRWVEPEGNWTWDNVTSRCIDAGNAGSALGEELLAIPRDPNNIWGENLRINMGAYGGTAKASMPPYDWALLADLTNDGIVNFEDFGHQAIDWRQGESEQPGDLDRNGVVDFADLLLLTEDWLKTTSWPH